MANIYSAEKRAEALKLADEIGATTATQKLGMNAAEVLSSQCTSMLPLATSCRAPAGIAD